MDDGQYSCGAFDNSTHISDVNFVFLKRNVASLIFLVMCCLVGLAGNTSVLFVYYKKFQKSNYRIYVLFLAGIDTVFCITVLPFYILTILFHQKFVWDIVCRTGCFLTIFLSLASLMILVIVAIDRYIVVRKPMRVKLGEIHAIKGCITALVLSGILSWYSVLLYGVREEVINKITVSNCDAIHKRSHTNSYILLSCSTLLASFFAITYSGIWSRIKVHARRSSGNFCKRRKTIVIYVAITTVFSVSTVVTISLNIIRESIKEPLCCRFGNVGETVFMIFSLTHCLNHVANPIIYYWRDQRFKKGLKILFCRWSEFDLATESDRRSTKSSLSKGGSFSVELTSKKGSFSIESMAKKGSFNVELTPEKENLSVESMCKEGSFKIESMSKNESISTESSTKRTFSVESISKDEKFNIESTPNS